MVRPIVHGNGQLGDKEIVVYAGDHLVRRRSADFVADASQLVPQFGRRVLIEDCALQIEIKFHGREDRPNQCGHCAKSQDRHHENQSDNIHVEPQRGDPVRQCNQHRSLGESLQRCVDP